MISIADQKQVILKNSIVFMLFLFPSLALTVKNAGSIIFVLLFLSGLLFGLKNQAPLSLKERNLFLLFFLFFIVMAATLFYTEDIGTGLKRLERFFRWLMVIPIYLLIRKYKDSLTNIRYGVALGIIVMGGVGLYQTTFQGIPQAHGSYHHILFGEYSVLLLFIVISYIITIHQSRNEKYITIVLAVICLLASILSGARGSWLAIPVVGLVLVWLYREKIGWSRILVISLVGTIAMTVLFFHPVINSKIGQAKKDLEMYVDNPNTPSSLGDRLNMWSDSIQILIESKGMGVGIGDYRKETINRIESKKSRLVNTYDHAHSIVFDSLATTGVLGFLVTFLAIFAYPYYLFYKSWKVNISAEQQTSALSGMLLVFSYFTFGLTETWIVRNPALNIYLIFLVIFLVKADIKNLYIDKGKK